MKLIKESLSFERGKSPKTSMGIGKIHQIEKWLDEMEIKNYTIDKNDFKIEVFGDVDLYEKSLHEFPEFIQLFDESKGMSRICRNLV